MHGCHPGRRGDHSRAELQVTSCVLRQPCDNGPSNTPSPCLGGISIIVSPSPGYYRHDRYGHLAGRVEAGVASVVRRLVD